MIGSSAGGVVPHVSERWVGSAGHLVSEAAHGHDDTKKHLIPRDGKSNYFRVQTLPLARLPDSTRDWHSRFLELEEVFLGS